MSYILRGWSTDTTYFNDSPDGRRHDAHAHFQFTIPAGYAPGDDFHLFVTAAVFADDDSDMPDVWDAFVYLSLSGVNGGAAFEGPYSPSGLSYQVGVLKADWLGTSQHHINQTWQEYELIASATGALGGVLPDQGSGETNVGWYPTVYNSGDPPADDWSAGREVTVDLGTWFDAEDNANPSRSGYIAIQGIRWEMSGEGGDVDLASLSTGFSDGATSVPWNTSKFNAHGLVTVGARDEAIPYQDLYLEGEAPPGFVDVAVGFDGAGFLGITVRSFECQTDSSTSWECTTPDTDGWACATADDDGWACVDEPANAYGVLLDVDGNPIPYLNGGRIKLI